MNRMMEVKDVKRWEKYTTTILKKILLGEVERRGVEKTELERKMSKRGRAGGAPTKGLSFPEVSTRKHLSCAPGSSLNSAPRVDDVALVSLDEPVTTVSDSFKLSFRGDHGSSVRDCQLWELVLDRVGR